MTTYWISNICALFNSYNIFPYGNDVNENFNALARLIIFITTLSLFVFENNSENVILVGGSLLFLSIILYFVFNRLSVVNVRENSVYNPDIVVTDPFYHNKKGASSYDNLSGTKKETGIRNPELSSAVYEIKRTIF